MNLPSSTPRKNTVKVVFTKDFQPYMVKAGEVRYVAKSVADRLYNKWQVIEQYTVPEVKKEVSAHIPARTPKLLTVEVKDKSFMKSLGSDWYPHSQHLVEPKFYEEHKENLDLVSDNGTQNGTNLHPHTSEDTDIPTQPKPWESATPKYQYHNPVDGLAWYKSHPTWNGQSVNVAVNSIKLAFQCEIEECHAALINWIKIGEIENKNGKISWNV